MSKVPAPAKTPTLAIARVLRSYGLKQGQDFRVAGQYGPRVGGYAPERIGTYVTLYTAEANELVAKHADEIEAAASKTGFPFRVSVRYGKVTGNVMVDVKNFGERVREEAPVAEQPVEVPATETIDEQPALARLEEKSAKYFERYGSGADNVQPLKPADVDAAARRVLSTANILPFLMRKPATQVADAHPYDGLPQKTYSALTWACYEAGATWFFQATAASGRYVLRVYRGRVGVRGWYLTGPGICLEGLWMGRSVSEAATVAEDTILAHMAVARSAERIGADWPEGTRVSGLDRDGQFRTGTVNGVDVGAANQAGHPNYGRAYVGVDWDALPGRVSGDRDRPFTDRLTRI